MANDYSFNQIATILNEIVSTAQGRSAADTHTPVNTDEFVSVANTALSVSGVDPIMKSVSTLINRTIFSFRPYNRKFKMLENSNVAYGNAVRKLIPVFTDSAVDQPMFDFQPVDGGSSDQWKIKRPKTVQTVIAGAEQYMVQAPTVFVDQLKSAFKGPDELMQFIAMQTGEVQNEIEQQNETLARNTVCNFVGAVAGGENHIHILTRYNDVTGLSLTAQSVFQPENFESFVKWLYAEINTISDKMTNRSALFHRSITGATILHHTGKSEQRLLMYAPIMRQIETMALSGIYHNDLLSVAQYEPVDFWQDFNNPARVDVTPATINDAGSHVTGTATTVQNLVAVLYDKEAMGTNIFDVSVNVTPLNAVGKYYNTFHHFTKRYWNDLTENGVIFTLD